MLVLHNVKAEGDGQGTDTICYNRLPLLIYLFIVDLQCYVSS